MPLWVQILEVPDLDGDIVSLLPHLRRQTPQKKVVFAFFYLCPRNTLVLKTYTHSFEQKCHLKWIRSNFLFPWGLKAKASHTHYYFSFLLQNKVPVLNSIMWDKFFNSILFSLKIQILESEQFLGLCLCKAYGFIIAIYFWASLYELIHAMS